MVCGFALVCGFASACGFVSACGFDLDAVMNLRMMLDSKGLEALDLKECKRALSLKELKEVFVEMYEEESE